MQQEKQNPIDRLVKQKLNYMKGQAIPLLNYYLLRDHILPEITGEFQSSILYWAGKDLASKFPFSSYEQCFDFLNHLPLRFP